MKRAAYLATNATYMRLFNDLNHLRNNISKEKTIAIFSNPRGGSTWLAEILLEIPKSSLVFEPLMRNKVKEFRDLDFYWHQPIPENDSWPEAKEAFRKLFNLEIKDRQIYVKTNIYKFPFSKYYIFKFCFGNLLLPWIVNNFNLYPILLLRHPCAVVASQMKHGAWEGLEKGSWEYKIPDFKYNDLYLHYIDVLRNVKTYEENLAATWALTTIYPIENPSNDLKWITLSYESLVTNYEQEIDRIFSRLDINTPKKIMEVANKPSFTTKFNSADNINMGGQLSHWTKSLSKSQIANILHIVKEFGIDFYDDSLEPDYSKIYKQ